MVGALIATSIGIGAGGAQLLRATLPAPTGPTADGLIAFVSGGHIHVVEPDGSGQRALVSGPEKDWGPSWSRDGRLLAYWSSPAVDGPPYEMRFAHLRGRS